MAKTAKEQAEAIKARHTDYAMMRSVLIEIAADAAAKSTDRLEAIRLIYEIDKGGYCGN